MMAGDSLRQTGMTKRLRMKIEEFGIDGLYQMMK